MFHHPIYNKRQEIGKDVGGPSKPKRQEGKLEANDDDVLEVLSSYKCYKNPTKENIELIITQLVNQELEQRPRYISNCWKPIITSRKSFSQFRSLDSIIEMYGAKKPTGKKVIKLLVANPQN